MQSWFAGKITLPCSSTCTIGGGRSILFVEIPQKQAGNKQIAYNDLPKCGPCKARSGGMLLCGLLKSFSA